MEKQILDFVLAVPSERKLRDDIRRIINDFFVRNGMMPPVSYDFLNELAAKLIISNGWDKKYQAFVMVCCGNAIWRKVVGTIPYNRRILLLPQCLKSSISCKAGFDQFGLLCENCEKCTIPDYIEEAEKLGYIVLVTEGTTVTTQLVESGKIDAVIGVGCMEVLQKMFNSVQKYSIPAIGIPLLNCGCKDTLGDSKWIKEEIYHLNQNSHIQLLNLNQIKTKALAIFTDAQLRTLLGTTENEVENIAIKTLLMGGNRHRVVFAAMAYEAFCKMPNHDILVRLALSVECLHKASLIHDDVEDNDTLRYGKETIHAEHGIAIAINTGDFLIGEGYRLIAEANLSPEIVIQAIRLLSQGHRTLSLGQGMELVSITQGKILSTDQILKVFEQKTATAFKVSILLGAIVGGADQKSLELLDNYSLNIGIAYQIMDDMSDFSSTHGDIEIRKFSLFLSLLYDKLSAVDKDVLEKDLKSNQFVKIYQKIEELNLIKEAENLLMDYIEKAKESISELQNPGLKLALHEVLGKMFRDYV